MKKRKKYNGYIVSDPAGLAIVVARKHFPSLLEYIKGTGMYSMDDIRNIGHLCSLLYGGDYKKTYNAIQRELYALMKSCGFRRTRKNKWERRECDSGIEYMKQTESRYYEYKHLKVSDPNIKRHSDIYYYF